MTAGSITFRITAPPFKSLRDGTWCVIVETGHVIEHVRLHDEDSAIPTIARLLNVSEAMAQRAVVNPRQFVTARHVKPKARNPADTAVMRALAKAAKPKR